MASLNWRCGFNVVPLCLDVVTGTEGWLCPGEVMLPAAMFAVSN